MSKNKQSCYFYIIKNKKNEYKYQVCKKLEIFMIYEKNKVFESEKKKQFSLKNQDFKT